MNCFNRNLTFSVKNQIIFTMPMALTYFNGFHLKITNWIWAARFFLHDNFLLFLTLSFFLFQFQCFDEIRCIYFKLALNSIDSIKIKHCQFLNVIKIRNVMFHFIEWEKAIAQWNAMKIEYRLILMEFPRLFVSVIFVLLRFARQSSIYFFLSFFPFIPSWLFCNRFG